MRTDFMRKGRQVMTLTEAIITMSPQVEAALNVVVMDTSLGNDSLLVWLDSYLTSPRTQAVFSQKATLPGTQNTHTHCAY